MEKIRCHCCGRELNVLSPISLEAPGNGYGKVCWNVCKTCRNKTREKSKSTGSHHTVRDKVRV